MFTPPDGLQRTASSGFRPPRSLSRSPSPVRSPPRSPARSLPSSPPAHAGRTAPEPPFPDPPTGPATARSALALARPGPARGAALARADTGDSEDKVDGSTDTDAGSIMPAGSEVAARAGGAKDAGALDGAAPPLALRSAKTSLFGDRRPTTADTNVSDKASGVPLYNALAAIMKQNRQQICAVFSQPCFLGEACLGEGGSAKPSQPQTAVAMQASEVISIPRALLLQTLPPHTLPLLLHRMALLQQKAAAVGATGSGGSGGPDGGKAGPPGRKVWPEAAPVLREYLRFSAPGSRPQWQVRHRPGGVGRQNAQVRHMPGVWVGRIKGGRWGWRKAITWSCMYYGNGAAGWHIQQQPYLTLPDTCPYLPPAAPTCPYLPLLAPTCPYLPLPAPS